MRIATPVRIDPEAPILGPDERSRVAAFLEAATAILVTTATADDPLRADGAGRVGLSVRSDGAWVWSDSHAYHVREHGLAPDGALLEHIRAQRYACEVIDADRASEVLEAFYLQMDRDDR